MTFLFDTSRGREVDSARLLWPVQRKYLPEYINDVLLSFSIIRKSYIVSSHYDNGTVSNEVTNSIAECFHLLRIKKSWTGFLVKLNNIKLDYSWVLLIFFRTMKAVLITLWGKPFQGLRETTPVTDKSIVGSVYIDYDASVNHCNGEIRE